MMQKYFDVRNSTISSIYPISPVSPKRQSYQSDENQHCLKSKTKRLIKATRKNISNFLSLDLENDGKPSSGLYGIIIVVMVILSSLIITIIPQQDIIKYPKYWPERMFRIVWFHIASFLAKNFDYMILMGRRYTCTAKHAVVLCIINIIGAAFLFFLSHMIWIYYFNYRPPIPFSGLLYLWAHLLTLIASHWFYNRVYSTNDLEQRKRFKWSALSLLQIQILGVIYYFVTGLFERLPKAIQPVLAVLMILIRYGSHKSLKAIAFRTEAENVSSLEFFIGCKIMCNHALCLTIIIGKTASDLTSYLIYAIDVTINLKSCFDIVRLHRVQRTNNVHDPGIIRRSVQKLVLKEILQILIPLTYGIVLCLSYIGPNAQFYGTHMIADLRIPLKKLSVLMLIDVALLFCSSLLLWRFCDIVLIQEYFHLMERYWKPITFSISAILLAYFYGKNVSDGFDRTYQFAWLKEPW